MSNFSGKKLDPSGACCPPPQLLLLPQAPPRRAYNLPSCSYPRKPLRWGHPTRPATLQPPAWGFRAGQLRNPMTLQLPFKEEQGWGNLLPGDVD